MQAANRPSVLIVDDHLEMAETLADGLVDRGYEAVAVGTSREAEARLAEPFDVLVTDLRMPGTDGLGLLRLSRAASPERPVILMTAYGAIDTAIDAMKQGAYHYLTKPFPVQELALFIERALESVRVRREATALKALLTERYSFHAIVGKSEAMRAVYDVLERIKDASAPVLISGETGTGKGLVARALHAASARASGPFVSINCASLPEALLESELFGHVRGAFTGATASHTGLFADADRGTLLLDEIGEMAPALQAKLLHVLERSAVRPVGASKERSVDVRVVAATHRDLRERVAAGQFREDLFYRLDVVTIELPALRHRREDIPLLIEHLLAEARAKNPGSVVLRVSPEASKRLLDHAWPGNVRELAHVVERLVLLGRNPEVAPSDLPPSVVASAPMGLPPSLGGDILPVREVQRRYAAWAFEQMRGQKTRTAERLGVDLKTLSKWLAGDS